MTSPTDPAPQHPAPGVPVALEPEDIPDGPLTTHEVAALLPKEIA